jgi:predicted Ser/Thr protein kinase
MGYLMNVNESLKQHQIILDKPDDSIPTEEWLSLSSSKRDFALFIYDIHEHFDLVVRTKLDWNPTNIKINQGHNNIVIGFDFLEQRYVFRVPKRGIRQLKTIMCIRQQLNGKPYFPNVIYYDDKCLIEHYADGEQLNELSDSNAFAKLAVVMADIHHYQGRQFGPLIYGNSGVANDFRSYYIEGIDKSWDRIEHFIKLESTELQILKNHWYEVLQQSNSELVICHGDLAHHNIFYSENKKLITLIDWDACGIYHKEKDLRFLLNKHITEEQRNAFLIHYPYDVDEHLLYWYCLTNQLKYGTLEDTRDFIDAANGFLNIRGVNLHLTDNSSVPE